MIRDKDYLSCFKEALNYDENALRLTAADLVKMKSYPHIASISAQTTHWQLYNIKGPQNELWIMKIELQILKYLKMKYVQQFVFK